MGAEGIEPFIDTGGADAAFHLSEGDLDLDEHLADGGAEVDVGVDEAEGDGLVASPSEGLREVEGGAECAVHAKDKDGADGVELAVAEHGCGLWAIAQGAGDGGDAGIDEYGVDGEFVSLGEAGSGGLLCVK